MACDLTNYHDFPPKILDAKTDVASPVMLDVKVAVPSERLLVFTGTAVVNIGFSQDDAIVRRGVVKVNLDFPIPSILRVVNSATTAGLGTVSNSSGADEDTLWAVDCVSTEPEPDPSDPTRQTLILTAAMAVQGGDTALVRMAYQANVLVQELNPELQAILVDNTEDVPPNFQPSTVVTAGHPWRGRLILTGPAPPAGVDVTLTSSNPTAAPVGAPKIHVPALQSFVDFLAPNTQFFNVGTPREVTITASHAAVSKTALVTVLPVPR